jgi:Helix-turn-helix
MPAWTALSLFSGSVSLRRTSGGRGVSNARPPVAVRVSHQLVAAIKFDGRRNYRIAQDAGIGPSTLSKLINGIERVRPQDPRVLAIAEVVGVPAERAFARSKCRS